MAIKAKLMSSAKEINMYFIDINVGYSFELLNAIACDRRPYDQYF